MSLISVVSFRKTPIIDSLLYAFKAYTVFCDAPQGSNLGLLLS